MRADEAVHGRIRQMVDRIVRQFRPERVILFGSHARDECGPDSDADLLVVMAVTGSKRRARLAIRRALHDIPLPKDIIVTTPGNFAWRKQVVGTVERPAAEEGKVLYTRT